MNEHVYRFMWPPRRRRSHLRRVIVDCVLAILVTVVLATLMLLYGPVR
jgi:hypothetical protein